MAPRPRAAPAQSGTHDTAQATGVTVLVVDDDPRTRHLAASLLQRAGFSVLQAEGGDAALQAFEAGADEYVTEPFPARVLIARLKAVLRRARLRRGSAHDQAQPPERVGDVVLDPLTHHAIVEGRSVPLSPTEYHLLRTLMRGAGRVFTAADLLTRVWGKEYVGQAEIVRANIYRLRRKLERVPSQPRYIQGRRGVGYHFAAQPS